MNALDKEQLKTNNNNVVSDIDMVFDEIISKGVIEREKEIFAGFKVKMRPLNTSELLAARVNDYCGKTIQ